MDIKAIANEFRAFALRGNVVDLAVGVIIGAAFGEVVKAFTDGIVLPLINALGGNPSVSLHLWVFNVGLVISGILKFLITAAVIFFLVVKPMAAIAALGKPKEPASAPPPPPPEDVKLLAEIRDLLKSRAA